MGRFGGRLFYNARRQSRSAIGRLNLDGTLDMSFNPAALITGNTPAVVSLAVQVDGRIW